MPGPPLGPALRSTSTVRSSTGSAGFAPPRALAPRLQESCPARSAGDRHFDGDVSYLAELLNHRLTVEARSRLEKSGSSRREAARRLKTSVPQLYRLLDLSYFRKSLNQLVALLHVLDCEVDVVVRPKDAA
jgi:hypothetical protein